MVGKKWSFRRWFESLGRLNKTFLWLTVVGLVSTFVFGAWSIYLVYHPPHITVPKESENILSNSGANSNEVQKLLQRIQDDRNDAIDDLAQLDFIKIISDIYKTVDSTAVIKLNQIYIDSKTGQEFRSDVIIEKNILGVNIKLLLRLNPYDNPIGVTEIESFQNHLKAINATKGIIITRGKFRKRAHGQAKKFSIDLATFKNSRNKNWDEKILVPFLLKSIGVEYTIDFIFEAKTYNVLNNTDLHKVQVSLDNGKNWNSWFSLFYDKWNEETFESLFVNGKPKKGELTFKEKGMRIKLNKNEADYILESLSFYYQPIITYKFKYLKPLEYIELKNLSTGNTIYAKYQFESKKILGHLTDWKIINDLNSHLNNIPNQITFTRIEIFKDSDGAEFSNPKVYELQ